MIVLRLDRNALMELIESQPDEFKFELSKAVLAEASRALVKGIIPEKVEEIVTSGVRDEVEKQIGEVTGSWGNRTVTLNQNVQEAIEKMVADAARDAISDAYKQFRETLEEKRKEYEHYVDGEIKRQFEHVAWTRIRQNMRDEVDRQMALMRGE